MKKKNIVVLLLLLFFIAIYIGIRIYVGIFPSSFISEAKCEKPLVNVLCFNENNGSRVITKDRISCKSNEDCGEESMNNFCEPGVPEIDFLQNYCNPWVKCGSDGFCKGCECGGLAGVPKFLRTYLILNLIAVIGILISALLLVYLSVKNKFVKK